MGSKLLEPSLRFLNFPPIAMSWSQSGCKWKGDAHGMIELRHGW